MNKKYKTGIVVLSGGQDSVTCLGIALQECENVRCISFDYGQRHKIELECAEAICKAENVPWHLVNVTALKDLGISSALIGNEGSTSEPHAHKEGLPASFVPARNALFLTLAHALAQEHQAEAIYTGVCQTDYSGYPDCREVFITKLEVTLNIGYETDIAIITPLMHLTKSETFALAAKYEYLDQVLRLSHTCYEGDHTTENEWGYGCGECPSCLLRKKGYEEYVESFNF